MTSVSTTNAISLTRALAEIKALDAVLINQAGNTMFIGLTKGKDRVPTNGVHKTSKELSEFIKAQNQSLDAKFARRLKLKAAVQKANVETFLIVNGETISISQAIDLKATLNFRQQRLQAMKRGLALASKAVIDSTDKINRDVEANIERVSSGDKSKSSDNKVLIDTIRQQLVDQNQIDLVDPLNLQSLIDTEVASIQNLETELDFSLSEVNAKTEITVD